MLQLQPMTETEFTAYKTWLIEDYARDVAENYRQTMEEALKGSATQINAMLGQGLSTPNNLLYNIVLASEKGTARIGHLWIDVDDQKRRCFIADIYIYEEFRHLGWGRKTLELLEDDMRQRGIRRINLHVFGNNHIALEFYRKMAYQPTGVNMQKWLAE